MKVEFYDKDEPTTLARTGKILMIIGGMPIVIEFLIMSLAGGLPMEMRIAWYDVMPSVFPISLIGLVILIVGWLISKFKWQIGELKLTESSLTIQGKQTVIIPYDSNVNLCKLPKHPSQLRIKSTIYSNLTLKFESSDQQNDVLTRLENVI